MHIFVYSSNDENFIIENVNKNIKKAEDIHNRKIEEEEKQIIKEF